MNMASNPAGDSDVKLCWGISGLIASLNGSPWRVHKQAPPLTSTACSIKVRRWGNDCTVD